MITLQNIIYPENSIYEIEREAYLRGNDKLRLVNGNLVIPSFEKVEFNTYMNFFSMKKWRLYARLNNVNLSIKVDEDAIIDVVGIMDKGHYYPEQVLLSTQVNGNKETILEIYNHDKFDILFLRVQALDKPVTILYAGFGTEDAIRQEVELGACICTFNRQAYLKKNLFKILPLIEKYQLDLKIYVSNNGNPLDFDVPDAVTVEKNRNLGGAGGFTRAMIMAMDDNRSHIVLMDDDIEIPFEALFRTFRFYQMIIPERRDVFLSGSMLSSEERWLQYERNAHMDSNGFHPQGHSQNIRDFGVALDNALNDGIRGLAGWWYCGFSTKVVRDFGLPMPIFVRGDDIEFSLRTNREIVSLNGVCVWHEPFSNKYAEIMEDYYLSRNMIINALLTPKIELGIIKKFVWEKFWQNIRTYNYTAARLNIYAVDHVLKGTYKEDAQQVHQWVNNLAKKEKSKVNSFFGGKFYPVKKRSKNKFSQYIFVATVAGLLKGNFGTSQAGFNRNKHEFAGRKEVHVFDRQTGQVEVAKLNKKKIKELSKHMLRSYGLLLANHKKIRRDLLAYRNESIQRESWDKILDR